MAENLQKVKETFVFVLDFLDLPSKAIDTDVKGSEEGDFEAVDKLRAKRGERKSWLRQRTTL